MFLLMICVWLSVARGAEARDVTNPVGVWQVQADSAMCYATSVGDTSTVSGTLEIPQSGWNPKTRRFSGFAEMRTFPNVKPSFATTAAVRGTWRLTGAFTADVTMTSLVPYTKIGLTGSWFYGDGDMTLSGAAPCPAADGYTAKSENLKINRISTTVPTCGGGSRANVGNGSAHRTRQLSGVESRATAAVSNCPLTVLVTDDFNEPAAIRSGLAVHSLAQIRAGTAHTQIDFVEPNGKTTTVGHHIRACESGCVDLLVTVVDPLTGKDVPYATVHASVSEMGEPNVVSKGGEDGSLCATTDYGADQGCAPKINTTTDSTGHAYIRYWAPPALGTETAYLNVAAMSACTGSSCTLKGKRRGTLEPPLPLTVHPSIIYEHISPRPLVFADALALYLWAHDKENVLLELLKEEIPNEAVMGVGGAYLKDQIVSLQLEELAEGKASNALLKDIAAAEAQEGALGIAEKANVALVVATVVGKVWNVELIREAMIADFLLYTQLDPAGLDVGPFDTSVPDQPSSAFGQKIASFSTNYPFQPGATGLWYQLGHDLYTGADPEEKNDNPLNDVKLKLDIYETSYCDPSGGSCEPGYVADNGTHAELDLVMTFSEDGHQSSDVLAAYGMPYNPVTWTAGMAPVSGFHFTPGT